MVFRIDRPARGSRGRALLNGFVLFAMGIGGCANDAPPAAPMAMPATAPVVAPQASAQAIPPQESSKTGPAQDAPVPAPAPAASEYQVGERVSVEWHGSWYPASILRVNSNGTYRIHYTGWESSWDESVGVRRLRH